MTADPPRAGLVIGGPAHLQVWAVPPGGRLRAGDRDARHGSTAYTTQRWAMLLELDRTTVLRVGWCYLMPEDPALRLEAMALAEEHAAVVHLCAWATGMDWRLGSTAWVGIDVTRDVAHDAFQEWLEKVGGGHR